MLSRLICRLFHSWAYRQGFGRTRAYVTEYVALCRCCKRVYVAVTDHMAGESSGWVRVPRTDVPLGPWPDFDMIDEMVYDLAAYVRSQASKGEPNGR